MPSLLQLSADAEKEIVRQAAQSAAHDLKARCDEHLENALAVKKAQAAKMMGICARTLSRLLAEGKIAATSYGTIAVSEIKRHLQQEIDHSAMENVVELPKRRVAR